MNVFKRFTNDTDAKQYACRKGQVIPRHLEKQFLAAPFWVQFRHNGKRYRFKLEGVRNRRQAERLARAEYARIVHVDSRYRHLQGEMPFSELICRFLEEQKPMKSYLWTATRSKRLVDFFGDNPIGKIRREDAIRFRDSLKADPTRNGTERSNADVNRFLEVLRAALNFAVRNEWLSTNPVQRRIMLREQEHVPRFFSDGEIERILDACKSPLEHIKPMIQFMLLTGCRTAEMLLLRWEDVDFEGRRVHFRNTKTAHDRFVTMGMTLHRLLCSQPRFEGCEYVFPNPRTNRPYGSYSKKYARFLPEFPQKAWQTICKRACLTDKGAVPYSFRRTTATALARDLGLHEAQRILGHASLTTTLRYAAVTADAFDRAAVVLEERMKRVDHQ